MNQESSAAAALGRKTNSRQGAAKQIEMIGVPLDLGQQRRGVDMGPSALRVAGLEAKLEALGHAVTDRGNVQVAVAETMRRGDAHARFLKEIAQCDQEIAERVEHKAHVGERRGIGHRRPPWRPASIADR